MNAYSLCSNSQHPVTAIGNDLRVHFRWEQEWNKQPALHLLDLPAGVALTSTSCRPALLGSVVDSSCRSMRAICSDFIKAIHQVHNATAIGDLRIVSCERRKNTWSNYYSVPQHANTNCPIQESSKQRMRVSRQTPMEILPLTNWK